MADRTALEWKLHYIIWASKLHEFFCRAWIFSPHYYLVVSLNFSHFQEWTLFEDQTHCKHWYSSTEFWDTYYKLHFTKIVHAHFSLVSQNALEKEVNLPWGFLSTKGLHFFLHREPLFVFTSEQQRVSQCTTWCLNKYKEVNSSN